MAAVHATDELLLLRTIVPIILEVVTFFTGDTRRATTARRRLASKPQNSSPSYAAICTDLRDFDTTLRTVPETLVDAGQADHDAVRELLEVIEEKFLVDTTDERDAYEYDAPGDYPGVCFLLASLTSSEFGPDAEDDEERIDWLINRVKLEHPRRDNREKLVAATETCHKALQPHARADVVDISWVPQDGRQAEWDGARTIYNEAERLHENLLRCWDCRCRIPHKTTKFAFDLTAMPMVGSLGCTIFYPSTPHWQPARLFFSQGADDGLLRPEATSTELPSRSRRASSQASALGTSPARGQAAHICSLLSRMQTTHCLNVSNNALTLGSGGTSYDMDLFGLPSNRSIAIKSWPDLLQGSELGVSKLKHRLTLALILSYAYLHLGGGPWWPYQRGDDSVHLYLTPDGDGRLMRFPFFSPSLLHDHNELEAPKVLSLYNPFMPSLPAFGKLLFELAVGHRVNWETIEREMKDFEDESHATQILDAVKACTGYDVDKVFTSGGQIRDNERLRMQFINKVVLKFQYVLDLAYGVKPQDIFNMPEHQPSDVAPSSPRAMSVSSAASDPSASVDLPSFVPEGFCLHDGRDMGPLDVGDAEDAEKWMNDLCRFVQKTVKQGLAKSPQDEPERVKIAVLDTGALISREDIDELYENRLVECRSWLNTSQDEGVLQFAIDRTDFEGVDLDDDGHGTHATSVLLDATEGTDIEVYVAQVFGSRADKLRGEGTVEQNTASAIAKAIRYAVDVWDVDIISMSFGFPHIDDDVERAIDHAYHKKKLMLAAASNCGGNNIASWPARCEHVICIHATTGQGNKYGKNPTQQKNEHNFAVLGCAVKALWLPNGLGERQFAHKSGTSTAAPIAAGLAGVVMSIMRRSKDAYLLSTTDRHLRKQAQVRYEKKLATLGRPSGMAAIFKLMVDDREEARDGYTFLTPMKMLTPGMRDVFILETMLSKLPD